MRRVLFVPRSCVKFVRKEISGHDIWAVLKIPKVAVDRLSSL